MWLSESENLGWRREEGGGKRREEKRRREKEFICSYMYAVSPKTLSYPVTRRESC